MDQEPASKLVNWRKESQKFKYDVQCAYEKRIDLLHACDLRQKIIITSDTHEDVSVRGADKSWVLN